MIVIGLTGSIAMGKSETARMFRARGIPVFDSDLAVHDLYAKGGDAVAPLAKLVPSALKDGAIDRSELARRVQLEPGLLPQVEHIVHPLVRSLQESFLGKARAEGQDMAVLDIPLLFETGREKEVDCVIVVSADAQLQRKRALARPGMTPEKLDFILSRQTHDDVKRARAHYVVDTSVSLEATARRVDEIIAELKCAERAKHHA